MRPAPEMLDGRQVAGPGLLRRPRLLGVWLAVLIPAGWVAHFAGPSGFYFDDFLNFREAQLAGLSLDYLLDPVGGFYFSPGHRLGNWLIESFFPMSFSAAMVLTVAAFAASLLALYLVLAEVAGRSWVPVVLTAIYGLSHVHVSVAVWWTSSLQVFPATTLSLACVWLYLRHQRSRRPTLLVGSVVALMVALMFHSKAVYVPAYLVLIRVLLLHPGQPLRLAIRDAAREWPVWLAYLVPVAAFSALFLSNYAGGEPSLGLLREYLSIVWFRVFVPGLFGAPIPRGPLSAPAVAGIVAAQVAFLAAIAWAVVRVPGAWRAVLVFAAAFLGNAVPIGLTRIAPLFGATTEATAYGMRYNVEATYMLFVAAAFVIARWQRTGWPPPPALRAASVVFLAVYGVLALVAARQIDSPTALGRMSAAYVDNVRNGLQSHGYSDDAGAMVNGVVPYYVMFANLAPANTLSEILATVAPEVTFDVAGRHQLFQVTEDGHVDPVRFVARDGGTAADLVGRWSIATDPPAAPAPGGLGSDGLCVTAGTVGALVAFTPGAGPASGDIHLAMTYSSPQRGTAELGALPWGEGAVARFTRIAVEPGGPRTVVFPLPVESVRHVYLALYEGTAVCLQHLAIGTVGPRP